MELQEQHKKNGYRELILPAAFALLFAVSLSPAFPSLRNSLLLFTELAAVAYMLIFRKGWLNGLLLFLVPLSVPVGADNGFVIDLPGEALTGLLAVSAFCAVLFYPARFREIIRHPLVLIALAEIAWMVACSSFSADPLVSFKRSIVRMAYVSVFMILFSSWLSEERNRSRFILLYAIGCIFPVINTEINHSTLGFLPLTAYWASRPFFNDHTLYGACLAFLLPSLVIFSVRRKIFGLSGWKYAAVVLLTFFMCVAEWLSFSRAAWVSLVIAAVFAVLVRARVRLWMVVSFLLVFVSLIFFNRDYLSGLAQRDDSVSSKGTITEHILSVANIQTDASNVERINRWNCAIRMAEERPLTGFGPGMYQFEYGRFQLKTDMTHISTYTGDRGHAHSEFFNALSETGFPGLIIVVVIMFTAIGYGLRVIYHSKTEKERLVVLGVLLGLVSFYVHGFFNAFLDTDKMAILVFGSMAVILATDISQR
ncbi:MAG TPA: O-antigen ligase family protein, partial [Bacteroidia bacterium]|nr:O-antigen ligase family protein [Bacteroidia bacterium]